MAFSENVVLLATGDTTVYTCPVGTSGSAHALVFSNITNLLANITIKLFSQATGITSTLTTGKPVPGNTEYVWPKPINLNPGDKIIASCNTASSVNGIASIFLDVPAAPGLGLTPRGTWSSAATYVPGDMVSYNGTSYIAVTGNTNDVPPSVNWMISAAAFTINAVGLLSAKSGFDNQGAGFTYLTSDTGQLFIRQTATPGTWSPAIAYQGPQGIQGVQGIQGPVGPRGGSGSYLDLGTAVNGSTYTLDYNAAQVQRLQCNGGAITIATTGWPLAGLLGFGEMMLKLVNGAASAINWPAINWVLFDGTTTTIFANTGVSLQTVGVDFIVFWSDDAGVTIYGKVMR